MALIFKKYRSQPTTEFEIESEDKTLSLETNSETVGATSPDIPLSSTDLKTCFVCGEASKSGQDFSRSYGGVACFSCRAFFRRATHRLKKRPIVCHNGNGNGGQKCNVTLENRQSCKKCRYEKCLENGMDPDLVLSEEQKVVRFRKLLSKKKKVFPSNESAQNNERLLVPIAKEVSFANVVVEPELTDRSSSYADPKVKSIHEKFVNSMEQMKLKKTAQVQLTSSNGTRQQILKKILMEHFVDLSNQFRDFAYQWRCVRHDSLIFYFTHILSTYQVHLRFISKYK